MASIDKKKKLRASILDRLLDDEPQLKQDHDRNKYHRLKNIRDSVRRDLENMLNTRYRIIAPADEFKQLDHSLLNYGLPDLATINMLDQEKKQQFINELESILKEYEPRFKSLKISFLENSDKLDRTVRFRIDATLFADPYPEVIIFDSVLEPVTRSINVKEVTHG
ncbi:MAG: type VI secretion system baseplate subunit TssE [Thiohalomonadales bacterium]